MALRIRTIQDLDDVPRFSDGRYKLDFMTYVTVKNGFVIQAF